MVADHGKTCIQILRVAVPAADPLALRLRLEQALASRDLTPSGLPPSAIVCVRRLRSSHAAIGRLAAGIEPATRGWASAWEQSVRDALGQLVAHAARPLREAVPANAECVIFNDRAEMLACLAMDWLGGAIGMRWWWRSLAPQVSDLRSALAAWMKSPEYIPAAWQQLATAGGAVEFAIRINAGQSHEMLNCITRQFALDELRVAFDIIAPRSGSHQSASEAGEPRRMKSSESVVPVAPWQSCAAEGCDISLSAEQKLLVGIALTLRRAPAMARTSGFAQTVRRWLEAVISETRPAGSARDNSAPSFSSKLTATIASSRRASPKVEIAAPGAVENAASGAIENAASGEVENAARGAIENPQDQDVWLAGASDLRPAERETANDVMDVESLSEEPPVVNNRESAGGRHVSAQSVDDGRRTDADAGAVSVAGGESYLAPLPDPPAHEPLLEARINTDYGGLFYLLNFALYLELYGDITAPSVRDISLGIWDFLALMGERLMNDELRRDPLWVLLARLAGRDDLDEPGADCAMPDLWRVPAEWLKPFDPEGAWRRTVTEGRLRVWHPAGFLAQDEPIGVDDTANQPRRESAAYAGSAQRWLDWLTPYARLRLQRALGLADATEVGPALFRSSAQVFVTATHLDVVFSLEELKVEIRLAGLDRDPGWIPATGRVIRFHFD